MRPGSSSRSTDEQCGCWIYFDMCSSDLFWWCILLPCLQINNSQINSIFFSPGNGHEWKIAFECWNASPTGYYQQYSYIKNWNIWVPLSFSLGSITWNDDNYSEFVSTSKAKWINDWTFCRYDSTFGHIIIKYVQKIGIHATQRKGSAEKLLRSALISLSGIIRKITIFPNSLH